MNAPAISPTARGAVGSIARETRARSRDPRWLVPVAIVAWPALAAYTRLGTRYSLDLEVYRSAATALRAGHNPYLRLFTAHHLPFTYPPFALLLFAPLSLGPATVVEVAWWTLNAACTVGIVYLLLTRGMHMEPRLAWLRALVAAPVLCLALEPLRSNLDYGQINAVLLLAVLCDLLVVRPGRRGILVGLAAAVKLTPAIFVIYFVVSRDGRAVLRSLASFTLATVLGGAVLPSESKMFWSHDVVQPARTGPIASPLNQSLFGMLHRWPAHHFVHALWVVVVIVVVAVGAVLAWSLVQRQQHVAAVIALGLTGELVSPVSWTHHWIWVMALPVLVVTMPRHGVRTASVTAAMVALVAVACVAPYTWATSGWVARTTADSLVGVGLLLLVAWAASEIGGRRRYA